MRIAIVLFVLVLTACTSLGKSRPLTETELAAVQSAEAFIARHGYTAGGHPASLPIENVELFDSMTPRDDLVKWRKGTMEPKAFGIAEAAPGVSWVLFHQSGQPSGVRAVRVEGTSAVQVVHSQLILSRLHWVRVPAH